MAAKRACAAPTLDAIRGRSWLPRTQFGQPRSGSAASYSAIQLGGDTVFNKYWQRVSWMVAERPRSPR
jgi:hypothetical protein